MNKHVSTFVISGFYYLILINIALVDIPRLGLYLFLAIIYPSVVTILLKDASRDAQIVFFALSLLIAIIMALFGPDVIYQGGF